MIAIKLFILSLSLAPGNGLRINGKSSHGGGMNKLFLSKNKSNKEGPTLLVEGMQKYFNN